MWQHSKKVRCITSRRSDNFWLGVIPRSLYNIVTWIEIFFCFSPHGIKGLLLPSQNASVLLSLVMSDVTQLNLRNQNLASLVSTIVKRFFTLLCSKSPMVGREVSCSWFSTCWYWSRDAWKGLQLAHFLFFPTLWSSSLKKTLATWEDLKRRAFGIQN